MDKNNINDFLNEYKESKKNDFTKDGKYKLKEKFKELWETYKAKNDPFLHQGKIYLLRGSKYDSHKLLWKIICEKYAVVESAKQEVKEEFKEENDGEIPSHLLELFTFIQELKNQEKELAKRSEEIHRLQNNVLGLTTDIRNRDNTISELKQAISNLENALAEQKALKNVIAKDESQKTLENYKKIANELNYGYSMFQESKDMEMSADLGEVLRDQLNDIYAILSKNGIILGAQ